MKHAWLLMILLMSTLMCCAAVPLQAQPTDTPPPEIQPPLTEPPANYLFLHDASTNMRKRSRISIMQSSIRSVLDHANPASNAGLRLFGHRFPVDGPDVCEDTELIIPPSPIVTTREDFEMQLNFYSEPVVGGGAPVGLALQQGLDDVRDLDGPKEAYLYLVDLIKCDTPDPIAVIRSACDVNDLHLTLIGFGLRSDMELLEEEQIPQLGCVDVVNLITNNDADAFPDRLLTRLSVEFRNADGELIDPRPATPISVTLRQAPGEDEGETPAVRRKQRTPRMQSDSIETVGLDAGGYLLDVTYQGQHLRAAQPVTLASRATTREVIRLGRLAVDVTDSQGVLLDNAEAREVQIVVLDRATPVRALEHAAQATFDLLPGRGYTVEVSYMVGGKRLHTRYADTVSIQEANHQQIHIALPIGSIMGRVAAMNGDPAPGVDVFLTAPEDQTNILHTVVTDDQGGFLFADLEAGNYGVYFEKPGYAVESAQARVVGGRMTRLDDRVAFHGIDISVKGVSGQPVEDAEVRLVNKATSVEYPVVAYQQRYRNAEYLPAGDYVVAIDQPGYEPVSRDVTITDDDATVPVAFELPYYITVEGTVINGKQDPLTDVVLEFQNQHSAFLPERSRRDHPAGIVRVTPGGQMVTNSDGAFRATLLVKESGTERVTLVWQNIYNQIYQRELAFDLPDGPRTLSLGQVRLPINFLQLQVSDIRGTPIQADAILLYHQQSGQSGIEVVETDIGAYESVALADGNYDVRIIKDGYQDADLALDLTGGKLITVPVTLSNYVTVSGTVLDGKRNRIVGATVTFSGKHSELTSPSPVTTGKDGRFRATLLVREPGTETLDIQWKSPDSSHQYTLNSTFDLPAAPKSEFDPLILAEYELPINFISLDVRDVASRGLEGAEVTFLAEGGAEFAAAERGGGLYASPDLPDGHYTILINKPGYKENTLIPDITVGAGTRVQIAGPVTIPHYLTVTGTMLNGREEGVANVEVTFGGTQSEQLERCFTDPQGRFQTSLLVTGTGDEQWRAVWKESSYSASGTFTLPSHPKEAVHLGDTTLPINFVTITVEDIYYRALPDVAITMTMNDGAPVPGREFVLEPRETGIYEAQYLPDGLYRIAFEKSGYETGRQIEVAVNDGVHVELDPMALGHYVHLSGRALNGKQQPVPGALISFDGQAVTVVPDDPEEPLLPPDSETGPAPQNAPDAEDEQVVLTDDTGAFSATLLVRLPRSEQIVAVWDEQRYSAAFPLELRRTPGAQRVDLPLPINFLHVHVHGVTGQPISEATVTFTHQTEKDVFTAVETEAGSYETVAGLPDGLYDMQFEKDGYEKRTDRFEVRGGEMKHNEYQVRHSITVRGIVLDGKEHPLSAAIIRFNGLKSQAPEKTLSGPDGIFETELLVLETGQESGTIEWVGQHGTYTTEFSIDLPALPQVVTLPEAAGLLPINFISLEVKSVAATGIAGASVTFTHRQSGQIIEAVDRDNGNYDGEELPDGLYDIAIRKDQYQDITLEGISVRGGEHAIGIPVPTFRHYMTISGVVLNGKQEGVSGASVQVLDPHRVQDCEPVVSREDGSFTLHALVTDVGTEPLDITWNDMYALTVPIQLPTSPEHLELAPITLPINFIQTSIRDIYGKPLSGVTLTFFKQDAPAGTSEEITFSGREAPDGRYESPELPDGEYLMIVEKAGYRQQQYTPLALRGGQVVPDAMVALPHLVTVVGTVQDGRQQGIGGAEILFENMNSLSGSHHIASDTAGTFREELLVTGIGQEKLQVMVSGPPYTALSDEYFRISRTFVPQAVPGEHTIQAIRLPINYIPISVTDVSKQPISDADISLTWVASSDELPVEVPANEPGNPATASGRRLQYHAVENQGNGRYEGVHLKDGHYVVTVSKPGYQSQSRTVSVSGGEVADEVAFTLSHYVTVSGIVTNGKGDGVPGAVLEFDLQNSSLLPNDAPSGAGTDTQTDSEASPAKPRLTTDSQGNFTARLLVKNAGVQRVRVVWQERYVKQFSFQLPVESVHYALDTDVRLPMNFVPVHVTNVLGEGLTGVDVVLEKSGTVENERFHLKSLGDGRYETDEIPDGVYTMTISKRGYQGMTDTISVQGGERAPEHRFVLPHSVTIRGVVVNGKGGGVPGAAISLTGLSSQFVDPETEIVTQPDGSFELELLVTGTEQATLSEHLEVSWKHRNHPFGLSHDFQFPAAPGSLNLGILPLPANFASVTVQDPSGQGLSDVSVTFTDGSGKRFAAQEIMSGLYEGQNLPNGVYMITAARAGYQDAYQRDIAIGPQHRNVSARFEIPYYVTVQGMVVDGKGQTLTDDVQITLEETVSHLVPDSLTFHPDGHFSVQVLVNAQGNEYLQASYMGEYALHTRRMRFVLPSQPGTIDLQRITLPMNVVPIEVTDLQGYGIEAASVMLNHLDSGKEMLAADKGNGLYECQQLPDGSYRILMSKDGYTSLESSVFSVSGGVVSEVKSFQLHHYVRVTGIITNGEGDGVRDPLVTVDGLRSRVSQIASGSDGTFDMELEVREIGNEQLSVTWKNTYRKPLIFKLPDAPGRKNLGDIRLPVNFLSLVITDISGSPIPDATVTVTDAAGQRVQTLRSDQNGTCKTRDLPNGAYTVVVTKAHYADARHEEYVSNGLVRVVRVTLPHYMTIRGHIKDITGKPVDDVSVIFDDFAGQDGQKLRATPQAGTGRFEQLLLIDDARFLERQRGQFSIKKGDIQQTFSFRISTQPNLIASYTTLLFPSRYLVGKVVDAEDQTTPIPDVSVSLVYLTKRPGLPGPISDVLRDASASETPDTLHVTTNTLGAFEAGNLQEGEYRVTIRKEGYEDAEDFVHISGLLQEKVFILRPVTR